MVSLERIKKIYLPVFEYTITIVITDDILKSRKERQEEIGHEFKDDNQVTGLHSFKENDSFAFIFIGESANINIITHECYHAIRRLTDWINATDEQETFAYHIGYLSQEIFDFLNIKNTNMAKKKKKGTY